MFKPLIRPKLLIIDRAGNIPEVLSTDRSVCTIRNRGRSYNMHLGLEAL